MDMAVRACGRGTESHQRVGRWVDDRNTKRDEVEIACLKRQKEVPKNDATHLQLFNRGIGTCLDGLEEGIDAGHIFFLGGTLLVFWNL